MRNAIVTTVAFLITAAASGQIVTRSRTCALNWYTPIEPATNSARPPAT